MTEILTPDIESAPAAATVDPRCTLLQYVRARRIRLSPKELSLSGQILAARCRAEGIDLPKVKERGGWRQTNLYPRSLLDAWEEHRPAWESEWHQIRGAGREGQFHSSASDESRATPSPPEAAVCETSAMPMTRISSEQ